MKMVEMLNLPDDKRKNIYHVSFDQLDALRRGEKLDSEIPKPAPQESEQMQVEAEATPAVPPKPAKIPVDYEPVRQALKNADAMISAPAQSEDVSISFRRIFPALAPSCPYVIYSPYSQVRT